MEFDKVNKEHILKGIQDFEDKGIPSGFKNSTTYNLFYEGKLYPPKVVMVYANFHASARKIEWYFKGGEGTECFEVLRDRGFDIVKKYDDKLYELKNSFLEKWSLESLKNMTLDQYTNLDKNSFGYWLEHVTRDLGSIVGGSSYKFGIYKRSGNSDVKEESNRNTDGEYAWFKKYGATRDEAFKTVKNIIVTIAQYAQSNNLAAIDNIDLGNAYKWKIAFLYSDYTVLNVFKIDALRVMASYLNIPYTNKTQISEFHKVILKTKPIDKDYYQYSHELWRYYQDGLVDVKLEFAEWLNKNTHDSYRAYLGDSTTSIVRRLDEINDYFEDIDLFTVNPKKVAGLISSILFLLNKKERSKNQEFVEYDLKNSNGIPKALLGKNNYIKFLESKFSKSYNSDEQALIEVLKTLEKKDVEAYFNFLDLIKDDLNLKRDDNRFVTSLSKQRLNLTFGQRYCWNLYIKNIKGKFGVISVGKINETTEEFEGGKNDAFYTYSSDHKLAFDNKDSVITAIKNELERTTKSSFDKYNNTAFERAMFDTHYRTEVIEKAFGDIDLHRLGEVSNTSLYNTMNKIPINEILYGPPGTGKTYTLQNEYFSKYTISETHLTREQYIENVFNDLSWFQVITLIVLKLETASVTQIIEHPLFKIKTKSSSSKNLRATVWGNLQAHTVEDCENVKYTRRVNPLIFNKDKEGIWSILSNELEELFPEAEQMLEDLNNFQPSPSKLIKNYEFITFHQSFSYEDFVEGIKPIMKEGETDLGYEIQSGVFKRLCNRAKTDPDNNYAIFIDEINRGNVSAIFGELITLIEKDKRAGAKNALEVQLPYSKDKFSVPANLHIYGTMNTADRSVEALDSALRRRFTFKELMPKPGLLSNIAFDGFTLEEVLITINERIEILVDRDHTIGHSYFLSVNSGDTMALSLVFQDKIIPLLQEYFYHDYEKLALFLGSGFVEENSNISVAFANFKNIELPSIENQFTLIKKVEDIEKAVLLLLNKDIEA